MIALLVFLIVLGVVAYFIGLIPMDATILQIIRAVLVIVAILAVFDALGVTHFGFHF